MFERFLLFGSLILWWGTSLEGRKSNIRPGRCFSFEPSISWARPKIAGFYKDLKMSSVFLSLIVSIFVLMFSRIFQILSRFAIFFTQRKACFFRFAAQAGFRSRPRRRSCICPSAIWPLSCERRRRFDGFLVCQNP